jgi:CBS domain-containing protein
MNERSLKDLFHLIKKVLPEGQELISLPPETPIREALEIMRKNNISQIPIVESESVMGVFSYKSLAQGMLKLLPAKKNPIELPVEEFIEDLKFALITDELTSLLDEFDLKDAVLVGREDHLQGIVTVVDALNYFYQVSTPYILLREIELAIRELIRRSISEIDFKGCIDKTLKDYYEKNKQHVPTCLEDLTFNDYLMILRFRGTWNKFSSAFGENSDMVCTKLERLPKLRNDVFHFRREITIEEYEKLRDVRDWLLKRIKKYEARKKNTNNE